MVDRCDVGVVEQMWKKTKQLQRPFYGFDSFEIDFVSENGGSRLCDVLRVSCGRRLTT